MAAKLKLGVGDTLITGRDDHSAVRRLASPLIADADEQARQPQAHLSAVVHA